MKEEWVNFTRIPCKIGFIDKWFGDSGSNPNNPGPSSFNLNSSINYYRLNGKGKWFSKSDFKFGFYEELIFNGTSWNAEDLWEEFMREEYE